MCQYLVENRAGEITDYDLTATNMKPTQWNEWPEYECTNEDGCSFLDDNQTECPIKENNIGILHYWAIKELAGDRRDKYTRVRELMQEANA